jgi:MFS family permease
MCVTGTAVPRITTQFEALDDVGWYGAAYLLTVTATQPMFGQLFRYFEPKLTYLAAIVIFEGMSLGLSINCYLTRLKLDQHFVPRPPPQQRSFSDEQLLGSVQLACFREHLQSSALLCP